MGEVYLDLPPMGPRWAFDLPPMGQNLKNSKLLLYKTNGAVGVVSGSNGNGCGAIPT